jgi:hypothetical protein
MALLNRIPRRIWVLLVLAGLAALLLLVPGTRRLDEGSSGQSERATDAESAGAGSSTFLDPHDNVVSMPGGWHGGVDIPPPAEIQILPCSTYHWGVLAVSPDGEIMEVRVTNGDMSAAAQAAYRASQQLILADNTAHEFHQLVLGEFAGTELTAVVVSTRTEGIDDTIYYRGCLDAADAEAWLAGAVDPGENRLPDIRGN